MTCNNRKDCRYIVGYQVDGALISLFIKTHKIYLVIACHNAIKTLPKKLNIPSRNCMKAKEGLKEAIRDTITEYKELILGSDIPVCVACLNDLRRQQVINQKVYGQRLMDDMVRKLAWEGLQKNIAMDGDTMIDKETGEVLGPEVDSTCWQNKF